MGKKFNEMAASNEKTCIINLNDYENIQQTTLDEEINKLLNKYSNIKIAPRGAFLIDIKIPFNFLFKL